MTLKFENSLEVGDVVKIVLPVPWTAGSATLIKVGGSTDVLGSTTLENGSTNTNYLFPVTSKLSENTWATFVFSGTTSANEGYHKSPI